MQYSYNSLVAALTAFVFLSPTNVYGTGVTFSGNWLYSSVDFCYSYRPFILIYTACIPDIQEWKYCSYHINWMLNGLVYRNNYIIMMCTCSLYTVHSNHHPYMQLYCIIAIQCALVLVYSYIQLWQKCQPHQMHVSIIDFLGGTQGKPYTES